MSISFLEKRRPLEGHSIDRKKPNEPTIAYCYLFGGLTMSCRTIGLCLLTCVALTGIGTAKIIYVDSQQPPTVPGMVAYWPMNDYAATKVVLDSGPNLLKGTAIRNTSLMSIPDAKMGRALNFNGTGDLINFGTNSKLLPDAWTFAAWVKCSDKTNSTLFSFGGTYPSVKVEYKGKPMIYMGASNYRYFDASAWTTLKDGQWHFVVFSLPGKAQADIQNAKMYLDGVTVAPSTVLATGAQRAKSRFLIGNNATSGAQRFKGPINNARLYNRALTDAEVQQIYQSFSPGSSWISAFRSVGDALTAAAPGDQIWVRKGSYVLNAPILVNKAVSLYGGFAGTETVVAQRNIQLNPTTVDGNNAVYHCFQTTAETTIDGFTITRGKATGSQPADQRGGGIYASAGSATVTNCILTANSAGFGGAVFLAEGSNNHVVQHSEITSNTASNGAGIYSEVTIEIQDCQINGNTANPETGLGGGLYLALDAPVIDSVGIKNNTAANGAGLYLADARAQLVKCTLSGNHASANGGGVNNFGGESESKYRACIFAANTAGGKGGAFYSGGGVLDNFNFPKLANCILVQNQAQDGGAIYLDQYASADVLNCTLSGNQAQRGGGLFVFEAYSYTKVMNTILWGDSATSGHPEIYFAPSGATGSGVENLEVYYSDIMTGWVIVGINTENLDVDPAFADTDGPDNNPATWEDNDYRILPTSPMIDKGTAQYSTLFAPTTDFLGTTRPQGAQYDIGAYEYASGQGLAFQADFDLGYFYTAPAQTQSFTASTQSCDVTWWLRLTNASGGAETWNLRSATFETPNPLGDFVPTPSVQSGNSYAWNNLTVGPDNKTIKAAQTTVKKDAAIPFTVTRAYESNAILGSGDMTTTVTVTPQVALESFSVTVKVEPSWTDADWWDGKYIGTVEHLSAGVADNNTGQLTHRDEPKVQEYIWIFKNYTIGQPITFTVRTRVVLNPGIPSAYLEPIVTVSGNRIADYGSEKWKNGTLVLPNGAGSVILDSESSMLTLDGYLPWYGLTLPHFARAITGDSNNDNTTDMLDLLNLSNNWLMPCDAENNFCDGADFDRNGKVDLMDFTILSEFWLRTN
jgi:hypothetical protein